MFHIEVDAPMPPEMYARYLVMPLCLLEFGFAWAAVGFAVEVSFLMYKNTVVHHLEEARKSINIEATDKFDHKKESRDERARYTQNYLRLTATACMCIGVVIFMMVDCADRCGYYCTGEPWHLNAVAWAVVSMGCRVILNAQELIIEGHHALGRSLGLVAILWILLNFIGLILLAFISTRNLMGYPDFVSKELFGELELFVLYEIIITLMLLGGANLLVHCRLRHQKRNCDAVGTTTKDVLPSYYYHNYI